MHSIKKAIRKQYIFFALLNWTICPSVKWFWGTALWLCRWATYWCYTITGWYALASFRRNWYHSPFFNRNSYIYNSMRFATSSIQVVFISCFLVLDFYMFELSSCWPFSTFAGIFCLLFNIFWFSLFITILFMPSPPSGQGIWFYAHLLLI